MPHRRINVFVEQDSVDLMEAIKAHTGLSVAEQVRRGLRSWMLQNQAPVGSGRPVRPAPAYPYADPEFHKTP